MQCNVHVLEMKEPEWHFEMIYDDNFKYVRSKKETAAVLTVIAQANLFRLFFRMQLGLLLFKFRGIAISEKCVQGFQKWLSFQWQEELASCKDSFWILGVNNVKKWQQLPAWKREKRGAL